MTNVSKSKQIFSPFSVMKMPPLVTRACTWACPAVKRTSTAAPTCPPTYPSRGAPKKPSGSPRYSAPPNSHKMVILHLHALHWMYKIHHSHNFNRMWFYCVFSGPSGSSELEVPSRQGLGHPRSITSDKWRGDCQGHYNHIICLIIVSIFIHTCWLFKSISNM